jgi:surfeit locus 1 family protein
MIRSRTLVALAAALAMIVLTVSLGNWQLRRAQEKLQLQASWDRAGQAEPIRVAGPGLADIGRQLPVRVQLRGRLLFEHEVWLDNRQMDGQAGLMLLTPLKLADGLVVLVNRGFAPRDARDRSRLPAVARPLDQVTIEGLAVEHTARVLQLGENAPAGDGRPVLWQNLDFDAFERARGLTVARWLVQQTGGSDDGLRRNWPRFDAGIDKHRGYALQWYSLAALIAGLTLFFGTRQWRQAKLRPQRADD